ncbi:MAG: hypothetical protein NZM04_02595 [Methylacidiphilales bacterium]|nr:hypothetical protein [Candidatus Methylacidiphilales bacterium]
MRKLKTKKIIFLLAVVLSIILFLYLMIRDNRNDKLSTIDANSSMINEDKITAVQPTIKIDSTNTPSTNKEIHGITSEAQDQTEIPYSMLLPGLPEEPPPTSSPDEIIPPDDFIPGSYFEIKYEQLMDDLTVMHEYGITHTWPSFPQITEFGIQIDGCHNPVWPAVETAKKVGLIWIKQQVRWGDIEYLDGNIRRVRWQCLDDVAEATSAYGMKLMFSITTSPKYLRPSYANTVLGPPRDLGAWQQFLSALLKRYKGKINAVEIWNEPNLDAEWEEGVNPYQYLDLLRISYTIIRRSDPNIIVISGGMAPLDQSSYPSYISDVEYLKNISHEGGFLWFDCVGYHANGPDGIGYADQVISRFAENIFYKQDSRLRRPLCITEFSFSLPINGQTPKNFAWAASHTEEQQAENMIKWMRIIKRSGLVAIAIVFNLNYSDGLTPNSIAALQRQDLRGLTLQAIQNELAANK